MSPELDAQLVYASGEKARLAAVVGSALWLTDVAEQAAEECSAVLELDPKHTGALMLRAQTFVALKDYQSALFDVNRLIEINPRSDAYRSLQARLRTQLVLHVTFKAFFTM